MDAEITFRSDETLTPDEFFDWVQQRPPRDVHHYELIQGRIVMTPPSSEDHGRRGSWLGHKLWELVERDGLGIVLDASAGYSLPTGDVLEPDVSFLSSERLAAAPRRDRNRFSNVVPDLAIEILSPSTAHRDRVEKKAIYAASGVREYWIVDGKNREVVVFHLDGADYDDGASFSAGLIESRVLPGLAISIEALFRD